ncbi:dipeptide/oligopeptide/nickel ABC transporter ATP-binding protein [Amycolatopsis sp.]|uniref:ABC transporter ATP-binding protein n=1 Tax=Amycolatopsis sp. TaxID=37632 RepID=UPI002BF0B6D7|nr:dipeptide/oligopeptide/nickel ABC transporter ATP-binding protein [Amycolatopsis sp.]HVV10460.1 dipeptide/oligopeptide/nickel ABC transporter ATP-binding protein [Amycolatopsis sp.]
MSTLVLEDVTKTYGQGANAVEAVRGVSLSVEPGGTLGLIGESGSGKSTLGRICLGAEAFDRGRLLVGGEDFAGFDRERLAEFRRRTSIVLQEPELALNPRRTLGQSVTEPLDIHFPRLPAAERHARAEHALELAHLDPGLWDRYPRELSGGQQQRAGIARAVVTEPEFVVLDEPTASLDLSVRGRILETLRELQERLGLSYLLITHDMATVSALAQRVVVLYKGVAVETGEWREVRANPADEYTRKLLSAVLRVRTTGTTDRA